MSAPPRKKLCTCTRYCKGHSYVSPATYARHRPHRDPEPPPIFGPAYTAFLNSHSRTTNQSDDDGGDVEIGNDLEYNGEEDGEDWDLPEGMPDDGDQPDGQMMDSQQVNRDGTPFQEDFDVSQPQSHDPSNFPRHDLSQPGRTPLEGDMDVDQALHPEGTGVPGSSNLDDLMQTARLEDIKIALHFADGLRGASLDDGKYPLDPDILERLRNPPVEPIELSPDQRLSLDLFLSVQNAAQDVYTSARKAILRRHAEDDILSYDAVKRLAAEISGISPITTHMCINSCIAYAGPFAELEACHVCGEHRLDSETQKPRQLLNTMPIGPQLQALKRNRESAAALGYREWFTQDLVEALAQSGGSVKKFEDFFNGSDYLLALQAGLIGENDIVVMLSIDGAQLFMNKQSDCWICIWVVFDHSPDNRYKKIRVLSAFTIPGPNKPKYMDSFLAPSLHHLSALQNEGLCMWDASKQEIVTSYPFFALGTADGPGMTHLNGLVGHMGKSGCRMYCGVTGRRKPSDRHYYPVLLKPLDYTVDGCDHDDLNFEEVARRVPSVETYKANLDLLVASASETAYKRNRLATGIVKPSIFMGLDERHRLPIPRCFGSDIMHHASLNLPDLLIPLWRGTFDCDSKDNVSDWGWAVLVGDTWIKHGKEVAAATPYLPGSFDRPPRDPAQKISSGYKAWEYLLYLYGLGPGLFYKLLPDAYYQNFCNLVHGIRIVNQYQITEEQLLEASAALIHFAQEFELLYYQRRVDRIHFIRQSVHQCLHLIAEIVRVGPPICSSQWTMERTIGSLTQELRQPSKPYANLSQRCLIRCRLNALKAMIPDLEEPPVKFPQGSIDVGNGYVLLRRRDKPRDLPPREEACLLSYLRGNLGITTDVPSPVQIAKWTRLRLPNGQVARSLLKESEMELQGTRMSRNVKIVQGETVQVAEVQFYFRIYIDDQHYTLALVSHYSDAHKDLLEFSRGTLWSSCYGGEASFKVIDVKSIVAVVAMVPHQPFPGGEERFFLVEKPGLDIASLGIADEMVDES